MMASALSTCGAEYERNPNLEYGQMGGLARAFRAVLKDALFILLVLFAATAQAEEQAASKVLADFEDGTGGIFNKVTGKIGLSRHLERKAFTLGPGQGLAAVRPYTDWPAFNFLKIDSFNPSDEPVVIHACFKDDSDPHDYFSWVNRYMSVRPGRSTLVLYLSELQRGEGSPKDTIDQRPFHWDKVKWFGLNSYRGLVELDNIRLVRIDIVPPVGVLAFDFGPTGAPFFPGTTSVTPQTEYSDHTGYGWSRKGQMQATRRPHPPDIFVGTWIGGDDSTFSVKVPNGRVHVWVVWEDPGLMDFYQNFTYRRILANGRVVLEETMNGQQFLDRYFHFSEKEDYPGDDIYKEYVEWRFAPLTFEVDVTNGRLDLTLEGSSVFAATVNGVIVYPGDKKMEAEAFIADLNRRRREAFYNVWNEWFPKRGSLKGEANGPPYIVYRGDVSKDIEIFDTPKSEEILSPQQNFEITVARDQSEAFSFAVYASKDLPQLKVTVSDFMSDEGKVLPADAFEVRVERYKFKRIGFGGAGVYGVRPWVLVDGTTTSAKAGTNRRYWITLRVPKDQPAGTYRGKVTLSGSASFSVAAVVRVLPFELPNADMGLGMFTIGRTAPLEAFYPENRARNEADREASLRAARESGMTQVVVEGIRFLGFEQGKAKYDFSEMKANVEKARRLDFTVIDPVFELPDESNIYRQALEDRGDLAKKYGFASSDDLVKELFGAAIRGCRANGLPDPYWIYADETPDTVASVYVALHRRMRDLAGAKSFLCWSPRGEPTNQLLDVTSLCSLNLATERHIKRALAAGNVVDLNNQGGNRWAYGLYIWKAREVGIRGYQQYTWMQIGGDPYYPLDSWEDEGGVSFPDRQGSLRPTAMLARIRSGINDYRYTLALKRAIERAKSGTEGQKRAAAEADAYLHSVLDKLQFVDTQQSRVAQMTEAGLNQYRSKVQDYLVRLMGH
jgi:hypothetical protein